MHFFQSFSQNSEFNLETKIVEVKNVVTKFGSKIVHNGVSLTVNKGDIYGLLGGSGSGKSTLLNEMIMLLKPNSGYIKVLGKNVVKLTQKDEEYLKRNWGVLFQSGALFSSLTVKENIGILLKEYTSLTKQTIEDVIKLKLELVGLENDVLSLYPSELSGGMIKRVSLARALVMDPKILFLDEPTSGLDPIGANAFDEMLVNLRDALGVSVIMVTHDLDSVWNIVDRFALLGEGRIVAEGSLDEVLKMNDPLVEKFFKGKRGRKRRKNG